MPVELNEQEDAVLEEVRKKFDQAESGQKSWRDQWTNWFRLYRSFRELNQAVRGQDTQAGRDEVLTDAQAEWGAELFIPYCFSTVETILPRMLSNRPRMLVLPRSQRSEENVKNMRSLIDSQQERIRYELKLQKIAKSGLIYGLGVQKVFWRKSVQKRRALEQGQNHPWVQVERKKVLFDDPDVANVDIFDWFWDPFASELDQCRYLFHRTWRDNDYVLDKIRSGAWRAMDEEDVQGMGPTGEYDATHSERMTAAGHRDWNARDDQLHEVWEFHDRDKIVTVLDRQVPVQVASAEDLYWHCEYPFVTFRPTESGMEQLPGIGEIEPIEDLQREMNTLRRQRRDNAALKLAQVMAYADGFVEPGDWTFFPGALIPVGGEPRDLLFPINVGDIPNSGYQEETNLQADIERTTGISDTVQGTGDASETATGVQLVQAAANVRIQQKTRRLEVETITPTTSQFGAMNQQMIRENREVRLAAPPTPGDPERRWAWETLGPGELSGEFDYVPEGGSTAPENVPQMRADALQFGNQFFENPHVDQRMATRHVLSLYGIKQPDQWIVEDPVPQMLPDALAQMGLQPEVIQQAIDQARQMEQQGPSGDNGNGGQGGPAGPDGSQNGGGPPGPPGQQEPEAVTSGG